MSSRLSFVASVLLVASLGACGGSEPDPGLSALGAEGRLVADDSGCVACHGDRGQGFVGPAWAGLPGDSVELVDGTTTIADDEYLRRAIKDPLAEIVDGFTIAMPENVLTDDEINAVIAYMKELG